MKTLTLRLTAPFQSYGNRADFGRRTTEVYPTKSAILGMVAAALGYKRNDERIISLNTLEFAVRIEQVGQIMTDFQIVEYEKEKRKLTYRDYLQEAVFMVALGGEDKKIDEIVYALKHPKFQLFLGRKANPPAGPLVLRTFCEKNPLEVLGCLEWQAASWYQRKYQKDSVTLEIVADAELILNAPQQIKRDLPKSLKVSNRLHGYRSVATKYVKLHLRKEHDVMKCLESEEI